MNRCCSSLDVICQTWPEAISGRLISTRTYTVTELIATGFPVSLRLGGSAMLLALLVGIGAGIIAALRQNRLTDHGVMAVAMTGISIPNFVMAPLLILVFAVYLGWLPAGGLGGDSLRVSNMILPVITLALPQIAYISRLTRGSLIEVLRSDFIRTARAKGLPERLVIFRHALRPALLAGGFIPGTRDRRHHYRFGRHRADFRRARARVATSCRARSIGTTRWSWVSWCSSVC